MSTLDSIVNQKCIIPIIVIDKAEHAIPLASALTESGFTILEITLRTPSALEAIEQISKNFSTAIVGAGTIIEAAELTAAQQAGAKFAVSPGLSKTLVLQAKKLALPYLPGIATASEALLAHKLGLTHVKFFPAESMGGIKTLSALSEVLPSLHFCPTGGINQDNFLDYLKLSCVSCIGGTWIAPYALIKKNDFKTITQRAKKAFKALKKLYN